jgi:hypothetical protein
MLVALAVLGALWQANETSAVSPVYVYVLHPTGLTGVQTIKSTLNCGWHDICDGSWPDAQSRGLDWVAADTGYQTTWVRTWSLGGPGPNTWVARAQSYYSESPCKRVVADVKRVSDWGLFGSVVNTHSRSSGSSYWNLYASTAGKFASAVVGSFVPAGQDNCQSSGPHTHQHYLSGDYDTYFYKNPGMPTEQQCVLCGWQYPPADLYSYEYRFDFTY